MRKIKVLSIFGTRPEAIKMCPIIKLLENSDKVDSKVCVTAQHRQMMDSVLDIFNVKPDFDLDIMEKDQSLIDISKKVLDGVNNVISIWKPDLVLVHGDTSTTFNSAMASFYNKVPIAHVEAGLRTGNIYSPFPEEVNRRLTSTIASIHFAPTTKNKENLQKESIQNNVYVTGNTIIDALFYVVKNDYTFQNDILNGIDFRNKKVILLTTHRRENWGKPMDNIFEAVKELVRNNKDVQVIFPMHKNPYIRELAFNSFKGYGQDIKLIDSLEYVEFANLMSKCYLIMTDSGGIQEEAPALGKPVIVLRTETERPEAVEAGTVKVAGVEKDDIYIAVNELLNNKEEYKKMINAANPYGDGKAAMKIVKIIENLKI